MKSQSSHSLTSLSSSDRPSTLLMSTCAMNLSGLDAKMPNGSQADLRHHTILWIDGIGGYLLWDKPELVLGQAFAGNGADVGIVGDLSRQAASIRRMGSDYLLQPLQATRLNGQRIDRPQLLRDGTMIELGASVKILFRRPNPLSATARLEMQSIHRWKPTVDALILLADCCILGSRPDAHIECREWQQDLLLVQKGTQWNFKSSREVSVDGVPTRSPFPMTAGQHIRGEDFSLSIE